MCTFAVWTLFKDGTDYYNINQAAITFELKGAAPISVTSDSQKVGFADSVTHTIEHRIAKAFDPAKHWLELTIPAVNYDYRTEPTAAGAAPVHLPGGDTTMTATVTFTDENMIVYKRENVVLTPRANSV